MDAQQIAEQMAQVQEDEINLNFVKWSAERRRLKLPADHSIWAQVRDETQARMKRDNEAARSARLAAEAAAKDDRRKLQEAELDRNLEPRKQSHRRDWLIQHPEKTSVYYDANVWPLFRQKLIEEDTAAAYQAELAAHRSMTVGEYSL